MAHLAPAENRLSLESEDVLTAGALGFMPRLLVLTTLPHRRPESNRFERVNGRHTLRMSAPRRVGLPYGSYSRLALDIYSWLTYRMSYLRKPCLIPWEALLTQFGADYGWLRDFKRKFLAHLGDVLHVYAAARLTERSTGLLLRPSPTHLPRAPRSTR